MIRISASTNPPKEINLLDYAMLMQNSGADYMHCDVMDGKFVSNYCLPISKIKELSFGCLLPMDVHLMVADPLAYIKQLLPLKVNYITVHYESFENELHLLAALQLIKENGILAGISIKPETPISKILPFLHEINLLMIMSVQPGKSGQKFNDEAIKRFEQVNNYRKEHNLNFKLEADGGVNEKNLPSLIEAGVDIAVVGSALFNSVNKQQYIEKLKKI